MPRVRATRTTRKRRSTRRAVSYSLPTDAEWSNMYPYPSFTVEDSDEERHEFLENSYVVLIPADRKPNENFEEHEYWVAQIKAIRAPADDPLNIWAKVQWYWSAEEVSTMIPSIKSDHYGKMERIISGVHDYAHSSTFQGTTSVVKYDEADVNQALINQGTFYFRQALDIKNCSVTPRQVSTCICGEPYNPDTTVLMHHCPRQGCHRSYHIVCLKNARNGSIESEEDDTLDRSTTVTRDIQFECTLPNSSLRSAMKLAVERLEIARSRKTSSQSGGYEIMIPPDVLALARSPMVKGLALPAGGVVGNIPKVAIARQIVYDILQGTHQPSRQGLTELTTSPINDFLGKDEGFRCPNCGSVI